MADYRIESAAGEILNYGYDTHAEAAADLEIQVRRNNWKYLGAAVEVDR